MKAQIFPSSSLRSNKHDTLFDVPQNGLKINGKTADVRDDLQFATLFWLLLCLLGNIRCLADNESGITN